MPKEWIALNKLIISFIVVCLLPLQAFADCEWKTGISLLPDGAYRYSKECHVHVGETVRDLGIANEQVADLTKAIGLKDIALKAADDRADLWMDTSYKLQNNINAMDNLYQRNKWLYFGLGVLAASAAVYAAGQLNRR